MGLCCSNSSATDTPPAGPPSQSVARRSWPARVRAALAWTLPIATLALIPKCPACVAGYVLLFTGIGISLPVAGGMRWAWITLCAIAITVLLVRATARAFRRRVPAA